MILNFNCIGELPAQHGFEKNIGVANFIYGEINGKFIIGGGSNFPYESNLNGGQKVQHKDIYLIEDINNEIVVLDHIEADCNLGEGSSVTIADILYYIQGDTIFKIYENNNEIVFNEFFKLPFSIYNGFAQSLGTNIYFGLGNINGELNNKLFSFDTETKELIILTTFPEKLRNQTVSSIYNNDIYIFSGGSATAYTDGFKYNILDKKWSPLASVKVENKEISILGAGHTTLGNKLFVIGGFNKEIWDEANLKLSILTGDAKKVFRETYLTKNIEDYNWNKKLLCYNFEENRWFSLGEVSFDAPCGNGVLITKNSLYSIMGEIRPGVRSNKVYKIALADIKL